MEKSNTKIVVDKQLGIEAISLNGTYEKIPSHFHEYYEIGFIKNSSRLVVCQNKDYIITKHDLLLFNPNDSHTCSEIQKGILEYGAIHISQSKMKELLVDCLGHDIDFYFSPQVMYRSHLIAQIKELHYMIMNEYTDLKKEELFYLIMGDLFSEYYQKDTSSEMEGSLVIERACSYIEKHFSENISLSELSAYTGFSKYYFIRLFTREKGISPYSYIESVKMVEAKKLLKTEISIIDVAYQLGFSSQSHFTNFFKKYAGVTPKQYKKLYFDL